MASARAPIQHKRMEDFVLMLLAIAICGNKSIPTDIGSESTCVTKLWACFSCSGFLTGKFQPLQAQYSSNVEIILDGAAAASGVTAFDTER
mmetsp:Transcript_693/g.904  ORF Transcript_693/g.904 Transcript_693/m.904 type:complete len:91 (+) Transcript_693:502-774(+)